MKSWKLSIKKLHIDYVENFNKIGQEMTALYNLLKEVVLPEIY